LGSNGRWKNNRATDPIDVFERMVVEDAAIDCVPLIYGYAPCARDGFRARRIAFADMPVYGERSPNGSALGGTGIAVSARTVHAEAARDFAYRRWRHDPARPLHPIGRTTRARRRLDERRCQSRRPRFLPRHARDARRCLGARHNGYMTFQHSAATTINEALANKLSAGAAVDRLNELFELSFRM